MSLDLLVLSEERIKAIVDESIHQALANYQPTTTNQFKRVSRREAAKLEGISVSMLDKIRNRYESELIGPRKRVFLVKDGVLVRKTSGQ